MTTRVAYVTAECCGAGHAVRGIALVRAGRRAGIEVRAFGPVAPYPALAGAGYEGTYDWETQAAAFAPDLLIGDLMWSPLDAFRARLGVPAWLVLRRMPCGLLTDRGPRKIASWERRISIEPLSESLVGTTDAIPPIVVSNPDEIVPSPYDGQDVTLGTLRDPSAPFPVAPLLTRARSIVQPAGYGAYWESVWLGYRDRVTWRNNPKIRDQAERVEIGGEMTENGADVLMEMIGRG